jgi:hypothetical protein
MRTNEQLQDRIKQGLGAKITMERKEEGYDDSDKLLVCSLPDELLRAFEEIEHVVLEVLETVFNVLHHRETTGTPGSAAPTRRCAAPLAAAGPTPSTPSASGTSPRTPR